MTTKFKQGDIIVHHTLGTQREIAHVYGGDKIMTNMYTRYFYVFADGEFSTCDDIDKFYNLSLKGTLKKL